MHTAHPTPPAAPFDGRRQFQAMLDQGWQRSGSESDLLFHPADHALMVRLDPLTNRLSMSPALATALDLVIPTPAGRSKSFWRQPRAAAAPAPAPSR